MFREIIKLDTKQIFFDIMKTFFFLFNGCYLSFIFNEYQNNISNIYLYRELTVYLLNSIILAFFFMFFSVIELQVYSEQGEMEIFSLHNYSPFYRKIKLIFCLSQVIDFFITYYLFIFSINIFYDDNNVKNFLNNYPHLFAEYIIISTIFYSNVALFIIKKIFIPGCRRIVIYLRKKYIIFNFINKNIDDECPICLEIGNYNKKITKCNHFFHKECLEKLFNIDDYKGNCPICREKII